MYLVAEHPFDPVAPPARGSLVASGGSIAVHLALLALALLVVRPHALVLPPPEAINVELVHAPIEPAIPAPSPTPLAPPLLAMPAPSAELGVQGADATPPGRETPAGKVFTATRLYAGKLMTEPSMAQVRRELGNLEGSERVIQLCNIEALEQIRLADPTADPDTLVGYAFADFEQHGFDLKAAGGAFRSRRHWYGVSYSCTAAADLVGVTAFQFQLGEEIPQDEWEAHSLTAEDDEE